MPYSNHTTEIGDWIIYVEQTQAGDPGSAALFGGPWKVGKVEAVALNSQGWRVMPHGATTHELVYDYRVKRTCLSRGEALQTLRELDETVNEFIRVRDNLKPRYQHRVDGLLLP